ncbi:MAG: tRNA (adenosine(37)-N6)-dimethylallyltransferase MiaA [Lachnospiraceae bacterium]|nr:tRNA (adenosine(37)-N6)-dimethylallyltransferase MiaA [Lachnospiraceae bacterium]
MRPLIVLTGPTAVGKTALSIALAKAVKGEIVSADSMQVYRHMDIGSAKITAEEMQNVPHHLIDILEPWEEFHVVRFQELVREALEGIYERGQIPILTGGTGFYIQAILKDVDFTENGEDLTYRRELEQLAKKEGSGYLHALLEQADPKSAEAIHPNNTKRIIRALEYYRQTGEPISAHNEEQRKKASPYNYAYFVLTDDRKHLYDRIDLRVDRMLADGLVEEVRHLKELGCTRDMISMQGLGYKEILAYLDGELSYEEAVYILKRDTRHFAKRQLTWFKREQDVIWIDRQSFGYQDDKISEYMQEICRNKGIL